MQSDPTHASTPVPVWTHEELSDLFWHHHNRFRAATGVVVALSAVGVAFLAFGKYTHAAAIVPAELIMWGLVIWDRAHSRLLARLRFRDAE